MNDLPTLPERPADGHKGTFGTVCVIGGQAAGPHVMVGGPALSAAAALRAGAGRAVLAMPMPILNAGLTITPSATGLALPVDDDGGLLASETAAVLDDAWMDFACIAIGPGLGTSEAARQVVLRLIGRDERPLVLDADALNVLASAPDFTTDLRATTVITPHPGEFRRLAASLSIDLDPTDPAQREEAAARLAGRLGVVVVLKGARTVISDGLQTFVNDTGNVSMATSGSGDVLTGVIAGLIGQYASPITTEVMSVLDCARLGVRIHGLAADRWRVRHGTAGLLATDLLDRIPTLVAGHRTPDS